MRLYASQAAAHLQLVDLQAGQQILTTLAVELTPGDNGRHVNGYAVDPNEGQQLLFSRAAIQRRLRPPPIMGSLQREKEPSR